MKKLFTGILIAAMVSVSAPGVNAQSLYGSLVGAVTDQSGAVLPRASVTVTQTETNVSRSTVTNESGSYNLPNLLPGTYEIVVTLQGFQTFTAREVSVQQNLALRFDAKMNVGAVQESVSVTANAVALQTESAAVQSLTTSSQLVTVPTSGRSCRQAWR